MIEYAPYDPKHLLALRGRVLSQKLEITEEFANLHSFFPATTVLRDGEVIACFGIHILWEGTGEAWLVLRDDIMSIAPRDLALHPRNVFDMMFEKVDRIQATVEAKNKANRRFIERFGFKREGTMKRYKNGMDFVMYARLK